MWRRNRREERGIRRGEEQIEMGWMERRKKMERNGEEGRDVQKDEIKEGRNKGYGGNDGKVSSKEGKGTDEGRERRRRGGRDRPK